MYQKSISRCDYCGEKLPKDHKDILCSECGEKEYEAHMRHMNREYEGDKLP